MRREDLQSGHSPRRVESLHIHNVLSFQRQRCLILTIILVNIGLLLVFGLDAVRCPMAAPASRWHRIRFID